MINIGIIGLGNIGQGTLKILLEQSDLIEQKTAKKIKVLGVADKQLAQKKIKIPKDCYQTKDAYQIINDPHIDIVVEVIGGEFPAYDYICAALQNKKHVITANKEVVSKHLTTFLRLAKKNNREFYYEASVGGGMPLIELITSGLAANKIQSLYGILNGTTNYILTKIEEDQQDFPVVLKEAQKLGLAEANPHMDISGLDVAYKLSILAATAFKTSVRVEDIYYEGIEGITYKDIVCAKDLKYRIKLLAIGQTTKTEQLSFKVYPVMVPITHPLAGVRNEFNAAFIYGNSVEDIMLLGKGAGPLPTGSAVVADIIKVIKDLNKTKKERSYLNVTKAKKLQNIQESESQFYLRLFVADTYGTLEKIAQVFGKNKVSLFKVMQKDIIDSKAEIIIITHKVKEKNMQKAKKELTKLACIKNIATSIRVGI